MTIKYVIHAKEWRDKINGNTYHSTRVLNTQNNLMIACPFTYGYGSQFLQSASDSMIKNKWIEKPLKSLDFLQVHNIVENNCKKKDVIEWGKVA
jgi:hypothetical protein